MQGGAQQQKSICLNPELRMVGLLALHPPNHPPTHPPRHQALKQVTASQSPLLKSPQSFRFHTSTHTRIHSRNCATAEQT